MLGMLPVRSSYVCFENSRVSMVPRTFRQIAVAENICVLVLADSAVQ